MEMIRQSATLKRSPVYDREDYGATSSRNLAMRA